MILLAAAALTAAIHVDLSTTVAKPAVKTTTTASCNIKTVGYRFRGIPGQSFRYAGDTYEIPAEGSVELLAEKKSTTYVISDRSLPLDVWPQDRFGIRDVQLPTSTHVIEGETR